MALLNKLPEELYHKIYSFVYADVLKFIGPRLLLGRHGYNEFVPMNSDQVRFNYLKTFLNRMKKVGKGRRIMVDYIKFVHDLERPVVYAPSSISYMYPVRLYNAWGKRGNTWVNKSGVLWWTSNHDHDQHLTLLGYQRLLKSG